MNKLYDNNLGLENLSKNEIPSQFLYEKLLNKIDFNIDKGYLNLFLNIMEVKEKSEQKNIFRCGI